MVIMQKYFIIWSTIKVSWIRMCSDNEYANLSETLYIYMLQMNLYSLKCFHPEPQTCPEYEELITFQSLSFVFCSNNQKIFEIPPYNQSIAFDCDGHSKVSDLAE